VGAHSFCLNFFLREEAEGFYCPGCTDFLDEVYGDDSSEDDDYEPAVAQQQVRRERTNGAARRE